MTRIQEIDPLRVRKTAASVITMVINLSRRSGIRYAVHNSEDLSIYLVFFILEKLEGTIHFQWEQILTTILIPFLRVADRGIMRECRNCNCYGHS